MKSADINMNEGFDIHASYRQFILRRIIFILALVVIVAVVGIYALTIGDYDMGFSHALQVFLDHLSGVKYDKVTENEQWWDDYIVWNIRLPRVLVAIVAGAGLALGGAAMQTIVHNPLADPYTTGISSGAVLGVSVALVLGFGLGTTIGSYGIVLNAFIFALIPAGIVIIISRVTTMSPATLILTGVAMSYMFNAMSTLLMVSTDSQTLQAAYTWQIGTLENVTWDYLPIMSVVNICGGIVLLLMTQKFNLLSLGDNSARSLGLNPENFRVAILLILSVMTASIIGFIGIIGFVGLVSPHIVRMLLGADNKFVIPASALFGAVFLLVADVLARTIIYPGEVPVGIVMSFVGAPIFLYLIIRAKKAIW